MFNIYKSSKSNKINASKPFIFDSSTKNSYFRDYYIKDFKYISPEALGKRSQPSIGNVRQKSKKTLFERWLEEVLKGLKQFFYNGSLHGVKYIFEPSFSTKERIAWIIIMVISVVICAVNIVQLFYKSASTPFMNVIDAMPTPIWAIPFPTVVICPNVHVKLSYANVSELSGLKKYYASLVCPRMSTIYSENRLTPEEIENFQEFFVKSSLSCHDVVKSCSWPVKDAQYQTAYCCNLTQPILTDYGLCFAFNTVPLNGMTNDTLPWQMTYNNMSEPVNLSWGLDYGYSNVFPPDFTEKPYRIMSSGQRNGLRMELYLNTTEYQYACDGDELGFTININMPVDHFYASTLHRLPVNKVTTLKVSPITYKTDSSLRSLTLHQRQCSFQDEKRLDYFNFYTHSNCQQDLLIQETKKECNCTLKYWPRKNIREPVCSTKQDFTCINAVHFKVQEQQIYAYYKESDDQYDAKIDSKSCYPACNDIIYTSEIFYSDLIPKHKKGEQQWLKPENGGVAEINVHFGETMFLGQHRQAQYDEYYFAGAIGGLLSLFLGFSIISLAEIVYFVILRPVYVVIKTSQSRLK